MDKLLPSDNLGQHLLNLMVCLIAFLFVTSVQYKNPYKPIRLFWAGFWLNLIIMFFYNSLYLYLSNNYEIKLPHVVYQIVQSVASLIGHTSLALIFITLNKTQKGSNHFLLVITLLTVSFIIVFLIGNNIGYVLLALLYGTLFLMISYSFRLIDIDTALIFMAYGIYSYVYFLDLIIPVELNNIKQATPLILLIAHLAFIRGIYKLVDTQNTVAFQDASKETTGRKY